MTDVIVIGSGPAGSSCATVIAKAGYNVLLIEKDEYPGKSNVCGGGMSERFVNRINLPENIIEKRIPCTKIYFPWDVYEQKSSQVTVLRDKFDRYLAEKAAEYGSKMLLQTRIIDVKRTDDGIKIYASNKNQPPISCNLVIFADGPNTLANKFGIGFKRDKNNTALGMVTEVEWENNPINNYEIFFDKKICNWGYGWIFPDRDVLNIGVGSLISGIGVNIKDVMNYFMKCPIVSDKIHDRKIIRKRTALIPLVPAKEIHDQSMLVVGDAAGMVNPRWGAGLENAIISGEIAGKVAVESLERNNFSKLFLSKYKREWEKTSNNSHIKRKVAINKILFHISHIDPSIILKYRCVTLNLKKSMDIQKTLKILLYPYINS